MFTLMGSILGVMILIIIVLKVYRTRQQHAAASNVVFAKYTFSKIPKDKQDLVHDAAKDLVHANKTKLRGFANEVERYGWYALAMDALGIESKVPENPCWYSVKNPYVAVFPGSMLIRGVCDSLFKQYNIQISVSEAKNYQGQGSASTKTSSESDS